jgi:hypothetical protein
MRDGRDGREKRDRRDTKFEVLGSKFRKPRTSDLEQSSVSHVMQVSHIPLVVHRSRLARPAFLASLARYKA